MKPETIKRAAKVLIPAALAIAGAYGYADENCTCGSPGVTPDTDEIFTGEAPDPVSLSPDDYLFLLLTQSEKM